MLKRRFSWLLLLILSLEASASANPLEFKNPASPKCVNTLLKLAPAESLLYWSLISFRLWNRRYPEVVDRYIKYLKNSDAFKTKYEGRNIVLYSFLTAVEQKKFEPDSSRTVPADLNLEATAASPVLVKYGKMLRYDLEFWRRALLDEQKKARLVLQPEEFRALLMILIQDQLRDRVISLDLPTIGPKPIRFRLRPKELSIISHLNGVQWSLDNRLAVYNIDHVSKIDIPVESQAHVVDFNKNLNFSQLVVTIPINGQSSPNGVMNALSGGRKEQTFYRFVIPLEPLMQNPNSVEVEAEALIGERYLTGEDILSAEDFTSQQRLSSLKGPWKIKARALSLSEFERERSK